MTAGAVIAMVARLGGVLTVVERPEGERVRVQPTGLLTPNLLEALQREKAGVIALLRLLQGSGLEGYAGDVLGFAGGPTTGDLLAKVERRGAPRTATHIGVAEACSFSVCLHTLTCLHVREDSPKIGASAESRADDPDDGYGFSAKQA